MDRAWITSLRTGCIATLATSKEKQAMTFYKEALVKVDSLIQKTVQLRFVSYVLSMFNSVFPDFFLYRNMQDLTDRKFVLEKKMRGIEARILKRGLQKIGAFAFLSAGAAMMAYYHSKVDSSSFQTDHPQPETPSSFSKDPAYSDHPIGACVQQEPPVAHSTIPHSVIGIYLAGLTFAVACGYLVGANRDVPGKKQV